MWPILVSLVALTLAIHTIVPTRSWAEPSGGWQTDGLPVVAHGGQQLLIAIHPDGSGGAFIFWRDDLPPDPTTTTYVSHITGAGTPAVGWPSEGLPLQVPSGLRVTSDRAGGFYLAWVDPARGKHIIVQRMDANGTLLWEPGGVEVCPTGGAQGGPIMVDDAGSLVVVWVDDRFSPPPPWPVQIEKFDPIYDVFAQKLDRSGVVQWDTAGVPVCIDSLDQTNPRVVTDGQGGALVVWTDSRGWLDADHLRMASFQRLDPSGAPRLTADGVGIGDIRGGLVVPDGNGGVIIASYDGRNHFDDDIYAQRIDDEGQRLWGVGGVPISIAVHDQRVNTLTPDGEGGALMAWNDLRNGQDWDLYAQRITSTGEVAPGWPAGGLPIGTLAGQQIYPRLVADGTGGCVITWYDNRGPTIQFDIYAQRILGSGEIAPGWPADGVALCQAVGDQVGPLLVPDGTGGAIVVWSDYRADADIYAQRVSGSGVVGETVVTAVGGPNRSGLQLSGFQPNPASRSLDVALSLGSSRRATLELIDVSGRLVRRHEIEQAHPGRQRVSLGASKGLRSGIYLLRLTQDGHSVVTRGCVLR